MSGLSPWAYGHPIKSLEGLTESEIYELLLLAWAEFGVGDQPDIKSVSTTLEQAQLELLGPGGNTSYLAREYVWGPGDGRGGVDELLAMFDRNRDDGPSREPWFVLQDDGGDIVALCDLGGTPAVPPGSPPNTPAIPTARVAAQWTYDAYGECLSADSLILPHPTMHAGHKGLFIDRLNEGVVDLYTGDPTPRLATESRILYQNRNRAYAPHLGRFMQQDPNASGQGNLVATPFHGMSARSSVDGWDLGERMSDSLSLYEYLGSSSLRRRDELGLSFFDPNDGRHDEMDRGLNFLMGASDPTGMIGSMYQSLFEQYAANLDADVDWAADMSLPDDMHSRMSDTWVFLSLMRGAASHYGLDYLLTNDLDLEDELDADFEASSGGPPMALSVKTPTKPPVPHIGPVTLKISPKAYRKAVAEYRAKRLQLWWNEVQDNRSLYAKNAEKAILAGRAPKSATGQTMAIHHLTPLGHGGHPTDRTNLSFITRSDHRKVHGKKPY